MICPSGKICNEMTGGGIKKMMRAKCQDASGVIHSEEGQSEKCVESGRINAPDTIAMIPQKPKLFGIHFQKERTAF